MNNLTEKINRKIDELLKLHFYEKKIYKYLFISYWHYLIYRKKKHNINFPLAGTLGAEMVCVFTVVVMTIAIPMLNEVKYVSSYLKWIGHNSYLFYLLHTMLITICSKLELSKIISYFAIIISISLIICIKQVIMQSCMKYAS